MNDLPVNVVDIVVGLVLLISGFLAYMRGFVHEVLSVGGWIGAILATIYGYPYVRPFARELIQVELIADIGAGASIFIVTLVVLSLFTRAVANRVQDSALNVLDRSLGFLFGLIRGALIVCLIYLGLTWVWTPAEHPEWMQTARSMPLIQRGAEVLRRLVPEDAMNRAANAARATEQKTREAVEAERLVRELVRPRAENTESTTEPAYDRRQRQGLERLIEGTR